MFIICLTRLFNRIALPIIFRGQMGGSLLVLAIFSPARNICSRSLFGGQPVQWRPHPLPRPLTHCCRHFWVPAICHLQPRRPFPSAASRHIYAVGRWLVCSYSRFIPFFVRFFFFWALFKFMQLRNCWQLIGHVAVAVAMAVDVDVEVPVPVDQWTSGGGPGSSSLDLLAPRSVATI